MSEPVNPYQPPTAEVLDAPSTSGYEPASRGRRFGTLVVDYFCYLFMSFLLGMLLAATLGPDMQTAIGKIPDFVFGVFVLFVYYGVFEGLWARTPGKLVFGTVVQTIDGGKPSLGQVLGRTACRFIPFEAFSFFGEKGWHDSIPKTRVMRRSPAA